VTGVQTCALPISQARTTDQSVTNRHEISKKEHEKEDSLSCSMFSIYPRSGANRRAQHPPGVMAESRNRKNT